MNELMTPEEVISFLRLDKLKYARQTLMRFVREKRLECYSVGRKHVLFARESVLRFLENEGKDGRKKFRLGGRA